MFKFRKLVLPIFLIFAMGLGLMLSAGNGMAADQENPEPESELSEDQDSKYVSIDFNNVDINVFIKFMSKLTGKNFVVDSKVKGNVTIISPTKISVKNAYKVFESVLDINGFSMVESGAVTKIIPTPTAKGDNIDTRVVTQPVRQGTANDQIVTRIVPLTYADASGIKSLFTPLVPKGSVVLSYDDTNMLIITATLSSIDRLMKIIKTIDVQSVGQKISVIPVQFADAEKIVKSLSSVFTAQVKSRKGSKKSSASSLKFVADERTNSVITLASKVETEQIRELIELLDREMPKGEEKIRVYYLEHAIAEDLVSVLTEIPSKSSSNSKTTEGQKKAPLLSDSIKILADKATNSLIIMADKEDYPVLEDVIAKLDIPRAMVYIECLIMEVNVTKGLTIGTEWAAAGGDEDSAGVVTGFGSVGDDGYSNLTSLQGGSLPQGFSVGVLGQAFSIGGVEFPDISAVVNAYQSDEDVNIISTPQILTMENEEATITVGKNVPYQTRSAASDASETYSSYEYKDVGITLKITPQISKDRLVRLNVYQELTKLTSASGSTTTDRPTTLKREIETTIIVEDANSVVIGGLIDESVTNSKGQTPCLGSIPGLGWAFKNVNEGLDKTNLYVFLTPRVVKNPLEAKKIYDEKQTDIKALERGEIILYNKLNRIPKDDAGSAQE